MRIELSNRWLAIGNWQLAIGDYSNHPFFNIRQLAMLGPRLFGDDNRKCMWYHLIQQHCQMLIVICRNKYVKFYRLLIIFKRCYYANIMLPVSNDFCDYFISCKHMFIDEINLFFSLSLSLSLSLSTLNQTNMGFSLFLIISTNAFLVFYFCLTWISHGRVALSKMKIKMKMRQWSQKSTLTYNKTCFRQVSRLFTSKLD